MSQMQILNAIKGKAASAGGLNIPEIKTILAAHGLPTTGSRQELILALKSIVSRQPLESQKSLESEKIGPFNIIKITEPGYIVAGPLVDHVRFLRDQGCVDVGGSWWVPSDKYSSVTAELVKAADTLPAGFGYYKLDNIITGLGVSDVRELTNLSDTEIDQLLKVIYVDKSNKISLYSTVEDSTGSRKVETLIRTLSGKLCRCIAGLMAKSGMKESSATPICINSVVKGRGLKYHGHRCNKGAYDIQEDLLMPGDDRLVLGKNVE